MNQPKKGLRPKVIRIRPLSAEQRQRYEDARWAQHDPEVQSRFRGKFVVPYHGKIVANGDSAAAVLEKAARLTGRKVEELSLVGIIDPLQDLSC